ncbi:MAG: phosphoglycerate dehydrogenase [Nitrospirota bacterium]|jgi:D-3-phosphoglycerate dehydrogenase
MKVLVSDNLSETGISILRKAGLTVDVKVGMSPEELTSVIGEYHGIVIRSATKLTADVIEAARNLKVIGRAGSGLDNVDKAAATKKGIVVMNTPGGNTITTAEHTIALMFSLARKVPQATASMKAGLWEKKKFKGVELFNKTLGVVGLGQIGSQVAKRARCLEMNVIAYDPFLSEDTAEAMGIRKVSLEEIFRTADFITVHSPLTGETRNLINKETIKLMKPTVRIINCARGGIVNEGDLAEALESGRVAGAALDVFEEEPAPEDSPLLRLEDNVVLTPHLGASTDEAQENVAVAVAEQIVDYLQAGTIRNAVNFPSVPADQVPHLRPYLKLAEGLGSFAAQLIEGGITEVTLEYRGEAAELTTEPVTMAAVKGLLTPILESTVNFVNAPIIARERGIEVKETKSADAGDYQSVLTLRVRVKKEEHSFSGTLFSRRDPRIIMVDNFPVEIIPEGTILVIHNQDKPGVIGGTGSVLASHGVNIAWMHFGRESAGGLAMSVVCVDTAVGDKELKEIRNLPNILSVKQIYL